MLFKSAKGRTVDLPAPGGAPTITFWVLIASMSGSTSAKEGKCASGCNIESIEVILIIKSIVPDFASYVFDGTICTMS